MVDVIRMWDVMEVSKELDMCWLRGKEMEEPSHKNSTPREGSNLGPVT